MIKQTPIQKKGPGQEYRAPAGGMIGLNGQYYKGGEFLPESERGGGRLKEEPRVKTGKQPVAPYVWDVAPADDMLSIWDRIGHLVRDNRKSCQFVKGSGFPGLRIEPAPIDDYCWKKTSEPAKLDPETGAYVPEFAAEYYAVALPWVADLCERFNSGERWFPLDEDPFHYKSRLAQARDAEREARG